MTNPNIKKAFVELVALLEENSNKKVSTVMPQILELVTKSKNSGGSETGKTFAKDEEGNVVAVYCYYHKAWELVANVEYGKKASTASGLNTMCKEGVSQWTKQNRAATKAKEDLLAKVSTGEIAVEDIGEAQERIEEDRKVIVPREDGHAFETLEEALA
jgi:hypothetical protein